MGKRDTVQWGCQLSCVRLSASSVCSSGTWRPLVPRGQGWLPSGICMSPRFPVSSLKWKLHCLLPQDHPAHLGWARQRAGTECNSLRPGHCLAVRMDTRAPLPLWTLPLVVAHKPSPQGVAVVSRTAGFPSCWT